jgi:hypothetical protein
MSRSRKKAPVASVTTSPSDQPWKKQAARKVRRTARQKLAATGDADALSVAPYELVNPYSAPKDGKVWLADPKSRRLRK